MTALLEFSAEQLREGDVLLSYAHGGIGSPSYWARHFDGGSYSHAAYWDGVHVVEAVGAGVIETPLARHVAEHEYVDVYRFGRDGAVLGDPGWPADVVTKAARAHLGSAYATSQLAVIGLLVGSGRRIGWPAFEEFLRSPHGNHFRAELERWKDPTAKHPLVCSQLVATAFREADPGGRYTLRRWIEPGRIASAHATTELLMDLAELQHDIEALQRDCAEAFARLAHRPAASAAIADLEPESLAQLVGATRREIELHAMVTPRDLAESSTLGLRARLV